MGVVLKKQNLYTSRPVLWVLWVPALAHMLLFSHLSAAPLSFLTNNWSIFFLVVILPPQTLVAGSSHTASLLILFHFCGTGLCGRPEVTFL